MLLSVSESKATMLCHGVVAPPLRKMAWIQNIVNFIVAVLYFVTAHVYDGICYAVSNVFSYLQALGIMSVLLFSVSAILVGLHGFTRGRFGWDVLGLTDLNQLRNTESISAHRVFKRLIRWTLRKGQWWVFGIGSIFLGPAIITPLLQKEGNRKSALFYLAAGTAFSVLFWVSLWSGVGALTWKQYVLPLREQLF
jgi:hypothetical protein